MKSNSIIYCPYAYEKNKNSGQNMSSLGNRMEIYLKNASVALITAKYNNPLYTVAFVTNLKIDEIPTEFRKILESHEIEIMHIEYDSFIFTKDYLWSLAFYKLCALEHMLEKNYEYIIYMDTDVYVQGNFDSIIKECDQNILLYDINHGLNTKDYKILCKEVKKYYRQEKYITHYGGEFFASNKENALKYLKELKKVYQNMLEFNIVTTKGDEFISSISANSMKEIIKNASPYINRFWTGCDFRLISTSYQWNRVLILHVPVEKEKGMVKIYDKYISKGKIPEDRVVWKVLQLSKPFLVSRVKNYIKKIINKEKK